MLYTYTPSFQETRRRIVRRRAWIVTALALFFWLLVPPIGLFFSLIAIGGGLWMLVQKCYPLHALGVIALGGLLPLALFAIRAIQTGGTF